MLEDVVVRARELGLFVVLDAKRGDIGLTAGHYAAGAAAMGADSITVNAYMGESAVQPFLEAGLAVFCLVRTSNPDSDRVQTAELAGGGDVASAMAGLVCDLSGERTTGKVLGGLSPAGAVVAATKPDELARLRAAMPDQVFLMPGVGAQGGTIESLKPAVRAGATDAASSGVLATSSRAVLYPEIRENEQWQDAVARAAQEHAEAMKRLFCSPDSEREGCG